MDIRILRYFLTVAKEQNFTKAAEQLNITQPTLSRQLAALEEELGTALFIRGSRSITLTESGILLKRRALEIIDLEEKMLDELRVKEELIEGTITIGCGEFAAVATLAEICRVSKAKYHPKRQNEQTELANWFGKDFKKLHVSFTSNLGTNAGVMAIHGLGYPISIEGAAKYWREDLLLQRRLYPEIAASTVIAWRRNIPYSLAMKKLIEEINAFQA